MRVHLAAIVLISIVLAWDLTRWLRVRRGSSDNRIQVFKEDGTYVKEAFIQKRTFLNGAASGFALSADPFYKGFGTPKPGTNPPTTVIQGRT